VSYSFIVHGGDRKKIWDKGGGCKTKKKKNRKKKKRSRWGEGANRTVSLQKKTKRRSQKNSKRVGMRTKEVSGGKVRCRVPLDNQN